MKTRQEQIREMTEIGEIADRILDRDKEYTDILLDETALMQPLMGSSMMYFAEDMEAAEAAAVVSLFMVVWGVYRRYDACRNNQVTKEQFAAEQEKTFSMFNFLAGEDDTSMFDIIARDDFSNRCVATLPAFIHQCFKKWPPLSTMGIQQNALVNMSVKTFIDCFELILREERSISRKTA